MVFYEPGITDHGLPRDPYKACVVPRPIGWISTTNKDGTHNLAPYSQFNNLTFSPPMVMFSANQAPDGEPKDTVRNVERTGEFCWSLATWDLRFACNKSAEWVSYGVDEFEIAGVSKEFGNLVKAPMVKESPVKFECKYMQTTHLHGDPPMGSVDVIFAKVVGIHIADWAITDGILDIRKTKPIARCGYYQYAVIEDTFDMVIPGSWMARAGLEGNATLNKEIKPSTARHDNSIDEKPEKEGREEQKGNEAQP